MIRVLRQCAAELSAPATLLSFEPTPREYFAKGTPPPRLTRFRERFEALSACGVQRFVCLRFDARMRGMSAPQYVEDVLVSGLGVRHVVVGHDFRFARDHAGTVATLHEYGQRCGFGVTEVPPFEIDGERVSSSLVRQALQAGDLGRAARLLGRPYRITGKVVQGAELGRTLGFATANLRLQRPATPVAGVFAVASLGTRPTVDGKELLLEAHVFDFEGDLYRRHLHVDFIARLRDELRFTDIAALTRQMHEDAAQAKRILQ